MYNFFQLSLCTVSFSNHSVQPLSIIILLYILYYIYEKVNRGVPMQMYFSNYGFGLIVAAKGRRNHLVY
jgi:hypothetical protein